MKRRFNLEESHFIKALKEFSGNLEILGYGDGSKNMLPACVREFLFRLEDKDMFDFNKIDQADILDHYEYLKSRPNFRRDGGLSSIMINHHIYSLRTFFCYLEQTEQIKFNPISALTFPSPESEPREILTIEQIMEVYSVCETLRDRAILGIYYGCGLRRSEGVKLNIRDVNFRSSLLYVREGKFSKRRVVVLAKTVLNDLKSYFLKERSKYIKRTTKDNQIAFILNNSGNRMDGDDCNVRLKELLELTQNPDILSKTITLHCLRHSIGTHLLERGMSLYDIGKMLGHETPEATTPLYSRVSKSQLQPL